MNTISKTFFKREQFISPSDQKKSPKKNVLSFLGKKSGDTFQISAPSGKGVTKLKTEKENKEGNVFILSGPSGTGKGTIVSQILKSVPNICLSVSATTRKPRPNEIDKVHYHFIDVEKFQDLIKENKFIEWAEVYKDQYYGTLKSPIKKEAKTGKDIILEIGANAHDIIKKQIPKAISIFIAPPSFEELSRRLINRKTESAHKINERLERAKEELKFQTKYDHVVVNDNLEKAIQEVKAIILQARIPKKETTPETPKSLLA